MEKFAKLVGGLFKTKVQAEVLARDLFKGMVLDDLENLFKEQVKVWRQSKGFDEVHFIQTLFFYLVANVTMALSVQQKENRKLDNVIYHFREYALNEAKRRWRLSEESIDQQVVIASESLSKLLFSNRQQSPGLSFDWSMNWLRWFGIEEYNPVKLLEIGVRWKSSLDVVVEIVEEVKVL